MNFVAKTFAALFVFILTLAPVIFAQASTEKDIRRGEVLVISGASTFLFAGPNETLKTNSVIPAGRRVKAAGSSDNGFVPLVTKSGRAWVRVIDVVTEPVTAAEVVDPSERPPRAARFPFVIERMTFDLGGSFGSYGDQSYTEVNLGLNTYFSDHFAWRNAVFGRFMQQTENIFGLDTSLRGILSASEAGSGFTIFAGPGYRFVNRGLSAPLIEGGLVLHLAGLSIGGGVKTVLTSMIEGGAKNDTQYFIILAGGGSL